MSKRTFTKDVHYLYKKINSFTAGQATVCNWEDEKGVTVEISPSDGYYDGGKFKFLISPRSDEDYPDMPPTVVCLTDIYHPNIDMEDEEYHDEESDSSNICVNLLESGEWTGSMTLEDCVQAILFLFYNPNWEDALSPLFSADLEVDTFAENVRTSLKGGCVEERNFERNYGMCNNETDDGQIEQEKFELEMNDLNKTKQGADGNSDIFIENVAIVLEENLNIEGESTDQVEKPKDVSDVRAQEINTKSDVEAREINTESDAGVREINTESDVEVREINTESDALSALPSERACVFKRSLSVGDGPTEYAALIRDRQMHLSKKEQVSDTRERMVYGRTKSFDFDNLMPCGTVLTALCSYVYTNMTNTVRCS